MSERRRRRRKKKKKKVKKEWDKSFNVFIGGGNISVAFRSTDPRQRNYIMRGSLPPQIDFGEKTEEQIINEMMLKKLGLINRAVFEKTIIRKVRKQFMIYGDKSLTSECDGDLSCPTPRRTTRTFSSVNDSRRNSSSRPASRAATRSW